MLGVSVSLMAACGHGAAAPPPAPRATAAEVSTSVAPGGATSVDPAPTQVPATTEPPPTAPTTTPLPPTTVTPPPTAVVSEDPLPTDDEPARPPSASADLPGLAGISMTSVPGDVIVPTNEASLDAQSNPINGRRSSRRPGPDEIDCATVGMDGCLRGTLDSLGFDVVSGPPDGWERRLQRATAVVQLDAGLPVTGQPDGELLEYLGMTPDSAVEARADEARQIGTSAEGRAIVAVRYGDGPRTILVVGQTHGDEEGGLRVLLRARSMALPEGITLWVVPTMNPDGLMADTRSLANGTNPNRNAPSEPEQLAVHEFALAVQPSLTVWYHQNYGWIGGSGGSYAPAARYHELTGLGTLNRSGDCAKGFMWCPIDDALGSSSILVELPDLLTPADVRLHADALLTVAAEQAAE